MGERNRTRGEDLPTPSMARYIDLGESSLLCGLLNGTILTIEVTLIISNIILLKVNILSRSKLEILWELIPLILKANFLVSKSLKRKDKSN